MNEHPASISALPVIPAPPAGAFGPPTNISGPPTSISGLPTSVSGLIDRWQSIGAFAADVGCGYEAARQMRRRGRIAPQHWPHVVAASRRLGVAGISYEWLAGRAAALQGAVAMQGEAA
ncbi:hypothetical protein SAMN03159463_02470 [Mesorhizobium sp. NFR06]|jgi:hypothetical protein|uniref:hypothetical protein n=1 Tax=Mesorhizobium sp. NFR06 TaxID=1566290 RepID=UPI0008E8521E|nr:hypothetical protein [Mesorhizobium sp. NFR06]SFO64385.1 hypothetical protein SAMN03159463_02470 [Mesorhizobium sp. NFR06]